MAKKHASDALYREQLPTYITVGLLSVSIFLVYFFTKRKYLRNYLDQNFKVANGIFYDKKILHLGRSGDRYYLIAQFEDNTTEEVRVTRQTFEEATANSTLLLSECTGYKFTDAIRQLYVV